MSNNIPCHAYRHRHKQSSQAVTQCSIAVLQLLCYKCCYSFGNVQKRFCQFLKGWFAVYEERMCQEKQATTRADKKQWPVIFIQSSLIANIYRCALGKTFFLVSVYSKTIMHRAQMASVCKCQRNGKITTGANQSCAFILFCLFVIFHPNG